MTTPFMAECFCKSWAAGIGCVDVGGDVEVNVDVDGTGIGTIIIEEGWHRWQ